MAGHVSRMREVQNVYKVVVENLRRPLWRPRLRRQKIRVVDSHERSNETTGPELLGKGSSPWSLLKKWAPRLELDCVQ